MKKFIGLVMSLLILSFPVMAAEFSDMPNDWSTTALQNAVDNGLITGSDGKIRPGDYMTRAEMAAIMVRAFGASEEADISSFKDVSPSDWFYAPMAKAVKMGAFTGSDNLLEPSKNITREQTFAVLSRMFSLNYDREINEYLKRGESAATTLSYFLDGDKVSAWAREDVAAIIASGYVNGNNGYINPSDYISRAEFASVMNRMVTTYVDSEGAYMNFPKGNVLVRANGVSISGAEIDGDLIIGEGAKDGAIVSNFKVTDRLIVRAGQKSSLKNGSCDTLRLICPGVKASAASVTRNVVYTVEGSELSVEVDVSLGE